MNISAGKRIVFSLAVGALLALGLLFPLRNPPRTASADPGTLFVTATGTGTACSQSQPCALQTALAQATHGDTVYVAAGTYTRAGAGAVVSITKSIVLYGGWNGVPSGSVVRDPAAYPTILDGQGVRRVVYIIGYISPTLDGFTITGGSAADEMVYAGYGGGIFSENASPIIQNNLIISNVASISPRFGCGGGIYLSRASGSALIVGNQVLSNTASTDGLGSGGGLYLWESDATVRSNLIQNNTGSYYGGGVYIQFGAPRLLDNQVRVNVAGCNAGGIYLRNSSAVIQGNLIIGNLAGWDGSSWHGGGLQVSYGGSPTITGNRILSNSAGTGGGMGLSTGDYFTVTNNFIAHNNTGGIMLWEIMRYGLIAHNTIANNGGLGIWLAYANITPTIVNNIVVSNTYGISAHWGAFGTMDYNDVWGNTTRDYDLPGALEPGPHDIQADPLFVNPVADDYHLKAGSPCMDAGTDAGVTTDIDDDLRPFGAGYDIGADEYAGHFDLFLPVILKGCGL